MPRVLPQDTADMAVSFFMSSYIGTRKPASGEDLERDYLDCVWPVWQRASASSPLRPAIKAVGMAMLEAWSGINPNSPQSLALPHYQQGLVAVRRHLQNAQDISDDVLGATLMLDMYESVIAFCGARPQQTQHVEGAKAMISQRGRLIYSAESSPRILLAIRGMLVDRALRKNQSVAGDVLSWTAEGDTIPTSPQLSLNQIQFQVANVQASGVSLAEVSIEWKDAAALDILERARDLDERLMTWYSSMPESYRPVYIAKADISSSICSAGLYGEYCTIYKSVFVADLINKHTNSRIRMNLLIMGLAKYLNIPSSGTILVTAKNNIQYLADDICATVPFFLGNRTKMLRLNDRSVEYPQLPGQQTTAEHYDSAAAYAGFFLTRRLAELLPPFVPLRDGQREWLFGQMGRIRKVYLISPS